MLNSDDLGQLGLWSPFSKPYEDACSSYGEADSLFRGFQDYILQILLKDTTFYAALLDYYANYLRGGRFYPWCGRYRFGSAMAQLLGTGYGIPIFNSWSTPSEPELAKMDQSADPHPLKHEMWRCLKIVFLLLLLP